MHAIVAQALELQFEDAFVEPLEKLNELWYAGFSNPESICRLLLQLHKDDKRRRAELAAAPAAAAAILEAAPEGAPG